MGWKCTDCGEEHAGWPKSFGWKVPADYFVLQGEERNEYVEESETLARIADRKHYIRCCLELPFVSEADGSLSFHLWIGVSKRNFEWYKRYRAGEFPDLRVPRLPGYFCAFLPGFGEDGLWSEVWFHVDPDDPLPRVEIDDPANPMDSAQRHGIDHSYWRTVVETLAPSSLQGEPGQ
ncbi:MAG: DUF2199 domain-containing protein [Pseudomonadota bacterium]